MVVCILGISPRRIAECSPCVINAFGTFCALYVLVPTEMTCKLERPNQNLSIPAHTKFASSTNSAFAESANSEFSRLGELIIHRARRTRTNLFDTHSLLLGPMVCHAEEGSQSLAGTRELAPICSTHVHTTSYSAPWLVTQKKDHSHRREARAKLA